MKQTDTFHGFKKEKELTETRIDILHNYMCVIGSSVERIEPMLIDLLDRLFMLDKKINNLTPNKHPYKCPVCEGKGIVFLMFSITDSKQEKCISCDGKGIVWG